MTMITIINDSEDNQVIVGEQTSNLIARQNKLSNAEKEVLLNESVELFSKCTSESKEVNSTTGLAIGYVQSGKTLSFTTITALAKDNNYRIVIILAGTKNNLLYQTTERLRDDLLTHSTNNRQYKVIENPDTNQIPLIKRSLKQKHKPLIILTALKHRSKIDRLTNIFSDLDVTENLGSNPVLIIDDEADQASLNTLARRNSRNNTDDESRTFESIVNLKNSIINHTFLQYTATPQGPLLIDIMSVLSPDFHVVLSPGTQYTGGQRFFIDNFSDLIVEIPVNEVYHNSRNPLNRPPDSFIDALKDFYIGCALQIIILENESLLSMMIHPDVRKEANRLFKNWTEEIVNKWIENYYLNDSDPIKSEFLISFKKKIEGALQKLEINNIELNQIHDAIKECLLDTITHLVISGSDADNVVWSHGSCHILIGGPKLDRGFTVKGLMTTYMPRYSVSISNADTIQQRCRFFGYKMNFLKSCRVYLPATSISEYTSYVQHEEYLRTILKNQSTDEFSRTFLLTNSLRPTRRNILSSDLLRQTLAGSKQTNAITNIENNTQLCRSIISEFKNDMDENYFIYGTPDRDHRVSKIPIKRAIEFLLGFKMTTINDREIKSLTIEYLFYHSDNNSIIDCNLIEMAYNKAEPRKRTLISADKITNIFTGRSTSGSQVYPGDKQIMQPDTLNIQLHKIRLENEDYPHLHNKVIYTLGLIYPENLRLTFTGTE